MLQYSTNNAPSFRDAPTLMAKKMSTYEQVTSAGISPTLAITGKQSARLSADPRKILPNLVDISRMSKQQQLTAKKASVHLKG